MSGASAAFPAREKGVDYANVLTKTLTATGGPYILPLRFRHTLRQLEAFVDLPFGRFGEARECPNATKVLGTAEIGFCSQLRRKEAAKTQPESL